MALANALAILLYLSCSVILIRLFLQKSQAVIPPLLSTEILGLLALIFHASDIFFSMKQVGGWDLGLFTTLTIASWLMAFLAFLFGLRTSTAHPGIVIYPLTIITLVLKESLPSEHATALTDPALEWHILLSLAAYSLFTLAALQALALSFQERQLRQHHINRFFRRLPPLQTMEKGLFQLLVSGFVLLSIGLITGAIFIEDLFAQHLVHKTVLSLVAWCVFATLLWGRNQYGWRGTTAVKWTLTGFAFLVMAYLGTKLVLEFILVLAA
ncbi:MAG: cytochrome c biogenesis protein CcsA [Gammaproteobacteria bacterium]|nr:cytochrome c biogenesis protein CcsA [Gammaproteobacteria bacterium]